MREEYNLDELTLRKVGPGRDPIPYHPITMDEYIAYWAERHENGSFIDDDSTREQRRDGQKNRT